MTGVAIALVALAFVLLAGGWLIRTRTPYAGTNSVAPRYNLAGPRPGQRLCIRGLTLPARANGLRLRLAAAGPGPARLTLAVDTGGQTQLSRTTVPPGVLALADFHLRAPGRDVPASACLTTDRPVAAESGQPGMAAGSGFAYLDRKPVGAPSVWYLHLPARRLISVLPDAAARAALFRAGFVGSWTYLAIALVLVLACGAGLRLLVRGSP